MVDYIPPFRPSDADRYYARLLEEAAAHIATLEAQLAESVKVKPLEWSDVRQPDEEIRYHHIIAESPIGQWTIQWKGWKDYDDRTVFLGGDFVLNGGDILEAAKSAAQADYERRILSALEATPPAPKVTEAMVDAASVAVNIGFRDFYIPRTTIRAALLAALTAAQEPGRS
jgi:hypothetical protein